MDANLLVPDKEAVLVEYPAFVNNVSSAVQSLGGQSLISAAVTVEAQKETELALHARLGDPLSHPIVGDRQPAKGLLLRVTRSRGIRAALTDSCRSRLQPASALFSSLTASLTFSTLHPPLGLRSGR